MFLAALKRNIAAANEGSSTQPQPQSQQQQQQQSQQQQQQQLQQHQQQAQQSQPSSQQSAPVELSPTTAFPPAALFGSEGFPQQSFPPSQFGSAAGSGSGGGGPAGGVGAPHPPGLGAQPPSGSLEAFFPPSGKASGQSSPPVFSRLFSSAPAPFPTPSPSPPTGVFAPLPKPLPGVVHADRRPVQGQRWRAAAPPPPPSLTSAPGAHTTTTTTASAGAAPDLLSFTEVTAAGMNGRAGAEATRAQILRMYACGPAGSQAGVARGVPGRLQQQQQQQYSPLGQPSVPCGPQFCLPGRGEGGVLPYSNSNLVSNNNQCGWVVQGVARQYPAPGPRLAGSSLAYAGSSAAACLAQPRTMARSAASASVSNANTLDLLQF